MFSLMRAFFSFFDNLNQDNLLISDQKNEIKGKIHLFARFFLIYFIHSFQELLNTGQPSFD